MGSFTTSSTAARPGFHFHKRKKEKKKLLVVLRKAACFHLPQGCARRMHCRALANRLNGQSNFYFSTQVGSPPCPVRGRGMSGGCSFVPSDFSHSTRNLSRADQRGCSSVSDHQFITSHLPLIHFMSHRIVSSRISSSPSHYHEFLSNTLEASHHRLGIFVVHRIILQRCLQTTALCTLRDCGILLRQACFMTLPI